METIKLKIRYDDRIGLVFDVSRVLFNYGLNILALQLTNNVMFLEIERHGPETWIHLKKELEDVNAILSVDRIYDMPYQSREKQIEAIMNTLMPDATSLPGIDDPFSEIIGNSKALQGAILLARQIAGTDSTVLLKGESGTGKELFARAIHRASKRNDRVFVPLNCGALPENLLESELFGYVDGAFTGAKKGGRVGLFQFASSGTIFLDEISELPLHLQVKLLRVLQESKIRPLGSNEEIPVNCRVITATNRNIEKLVQKGLFREDLYYRLNVIPIQIPPLRHRKEDLLLLAKNHLDKFRQKDGIEKRITPGALEKLLSYDWPGNVRELENVMERAHHLSPGEEIGCRHILFDGETGGIGNSFPEPKKEDLKGAVARAEKEVLQTALGVHGSIRKTARALGVSHTTIANKLKKYGIENVN